MAQPRVCARARAVDALQCGKGVALERGEFNRVRRGGETVDFRQLRARRNCAGRRGAVVGGVDNLAA